MFRSEISRYFNGFYDSKSQFSSFFEHLGTLAKMQGQKIYGTLSSWHYFIVYCIYDEAFDV